MKQENKSIIVITILSIIILGLIISLVCIIINYNKITGDFDKAVNGLINKDTAALKVGNKEIILSKGDKVSILKDDIINDCFIVKYEDKYGTIKKDDVSYYTFDSNTTYSLMLDVSSFNVKTSESDTSRNFSNSTDFALFTLDSNINYVYIRLGGRGWGEKGNLYYDEDAPMFIEACEYLKIPYGFYYLDEALNDDEIIEEVEFVKSFLNNNKTSYNVLPLVIDLEYQDGRGRADDIWEERVPILNRLIEEFKNNKIETLIYSNGLRIDKYIKSVNSKFWVAYYPQNNIIPKSDYSTYVKLEEMQQFIDSLLLENSNLSISEVEDTVRNKFYSDEYLNKIIAWQFSENGAKYSNINERIDLSLVDNEFFKQYVVKQID